MFGDVAKEKHFAGVGSKVDMSRNKEMLWILRFYSKTPDSPHPGPMTNKTVIYAPVGVYSHVKGRHAP
jgi:hypothetical protein